MNAILKTALLVSWAFFLCLGAAPLISQEHLAILEGVVVMEDGTPIPGVAVSAKNAQTGIVYSSITNDKGKFFISGIAPGKYDITAQLQGFDEVTQKDMTLYTGSRKTVNFNLKTSKISEKITVVASVPVVELKKSEISSVVDRQQIDSLPLLSRDFNTLTFTKPGVSEDRLGDPRSNAAPGGMGEILIDGVSNEELVNNITRASIPADAIQEFNVMTNQFAAEYGNASGLLRSAITRSGTNVLQGRLAYFYRDEILDTPNYFVNHDSYQGPEKKGFDKAPYNHNNFSLTLGGPIVKDKAHFFFAYEGLIETRYATINSPLVSKETVKQPQNVHQFLLKLDYRLNPKNYFSLRFLYSPDKRENLYVGGLQDKSMGTTWDIKPVDFQLNWNFYPSNNSINEMRLLYASRNQDFYASDDAYKNTFFEIRPSLIKGKINWYPQWTHERRLQFIDNFTIFSNKHTFKFGVDISTIPEKAHVEKNMPGMYVFASDSPFNAIDPNTYPVIGFFYSGPTDFSLDNVAGGLFFQDNWEVSKRLTLNLGLRFNYIKTKGLDIKAFDYRHINPRIGFGWDPVGDGRTSLRGGWGIFTANPMSNAGFFADVLDQLRDTIIYFPNYPDPKIDNPFWALIGVSRNDMIVPPDNPLNDRYSSKKDIIAPYTSQFTIGIQREIIKDWSASVDVAWSKGYHLIRQENDNAVIPGTFNPANPAAMKRYQDINRGNLYVQTDNGRSEYTAFLFNVNKRYKNGWSLEASYTLSWAKADTEAEWASLVHNDDKDWKRQYGYIDSDGRHRVIINGIVDLPWKFQLSGIFRYHSAYPWTAVYGYDQNMDSTQGDYYDQVRNIRRGFDFYQLDLRLSKYVKVSTFSLQLFAEFFNLTNHTNFIDIFNVYGASLFGKPLTALDPRLMQLGIRFDF